MAAGRPVVLAIEGVIQAVVENADCGVYPRPGNAQDMANALQFLESDRQHAHKLGMNGRTYLEEHFSRERMAEMLAGIFEEMF